jgi:aminoglycoside N3'-acetyltransferase
MLNNKLFKKKIEKFLFSNLKKIKIKKNDIVYLGLDLYKFYYPFIKFISNYPKKNLDHYLCRFFFSLLKKYFNKKGTLIYPGFTWSFIKKKKFHKHKTIPEIGSFGKYLYKQSDIERSNHPINSLLSWGNKKKEITKIHGPYSFGFNTPFEKFLNYNVKFLNIGIPFYDTCTYVHHLEHLNGCNHRYYKLIKGKYFVDGKYYKKNFFFLAKYKSFSKNVKRNEKLFYKFLLKNKKVSSVINSSVLFTSIKTKDVFKAGMNFLIKDSSYFMSKKIEINFKETKKPIKTNKNEIKINYKLNF